jgi:hypothetical protein
LNVGRLFAVAFSPDSRLLAGGAWDGSVRVWDVPTGKELLHLDRHQGPVRRVVFSPDGKWLASAGKPPGLCLWQLPTGRLTRTLGPAKQEFADVAFSPDGTKVGGVGRGKLYVWDLSGKDNWSDGGDHRHSRLAFPGPDSVSSISFKPVARGNVPGNVFEENGYLRSWSLPSGKELSTHALGSDAALGSVTFSPDGRLVALQTVTGTTQDQEIKYLQAFPLEPAPEIHLAGLAVSAVCISPDRRMLALTGDSWAREGDRGPKFIRVFEIASGRERCRFRSVDQGKLSQAISPDGRTLASGSIDVTAVLWDLTGGQAREKHTPSAADLARLWDDLKGADAAVAYRSHWKLAAAAEQAVPLLAQRLRPAAAPDPKRLAALVGDLADSHFQKRSRASAELLKLEELAEPALRAALRGGADLDVRRRIEQLLKKVEQPSPERLRQLRAVEVLEHTATPAARALLGELAKGAPEASLSRAAHEACRRLERRIP